MVKATFKENRKETTTEELEQYDYGQVLQIEGLQLPAATQVHFSTNEIEGEARVEAASTKNGITTVTIPDVFLGENAIPKTYDKTEYNIFGWIYFDDGTSGRTAYRIHMPVKRRPKPSSYTPAEEERLKSTLAQITQVANNIEAKEKANEAAIENLKATKVTGDGIRMYYNTVKKCITVEVEE